MKNKQWLGELRLADDLELVYVVPLKRKPFLAIVNLNFSELKRIVIYLRKNMAEMKKTTGVGE